MSERCDVVVIGGGPTGLMTAWKLAERKLRVILLETKKRAYRYKRPCSAMIILEPEFHGEVVRTEPGKIIFEKTGLSAPYDGEYQTLNKSIKFSPSGYKFLITNSDGNPLAKTINKEALLKTIYDRALEAGVEIREGETGVAVENENSCVEVTSRRGGSLYRINSSYAVAADGVDSAMIKSLGLSRNRKLYFKPRVASFEFENLDCPYPDSYMTFQGKAFCSVGYFTITPKPSKESGKIKYEIVIIPDPSKGETGKGILEKLLSTDLIKPWFKKARMIARHGCRWSLWDPIKDPVCGRVVLAGDAPSFQEVEIQGAFMCGYKVAEAIFSEIENGNGFEEYRRFWLESFEFNDDEILYKTAKGFGLRNLGDEELDFLFSLVDGKDLEGTINHFKVGETMLLEFGKRMDVIRRKRPDIAIKLEKFTQAGIDKFFE